MSVASIPAVQPLDPDDVIGVPGVVVPGICEVVIHVNVPSTHKQPSQH